MNTNQNIKKWYTEIEVIDVETGEIHTKNININQWIKIRNTIKYEINNDNGIRKISYECRKRPEQYRCEFEMF